MLQAIGLLLTHTGSVKEENRRPCNVTCSTPMQHGHVLGNPLLPARPPALVTLCMLSCHAVQGAVGTRQGEAMTQADFIYSKFSLFIINFKSFQAGAHLVTFLRKR